MPEASLTAIISPVHILPSFLTFLLASNISKLPPDTVTVAATSATEAPGVIPVIVLLEFLFKVVFIVNDGFTVPPLPPGFVVPPPAGLSCLTIVIVYVLAEPF